MSYFTDHGEKSMRRLIAFWSMSLITSMVVGVFFGVVIDTQIFVIVGSICTIAIGSSAIKNKINKNV